ncbi:CPCC family cysteine-rich protein [Streptomyces sp. NPDC017448]
MSDSCPCCGHRVLDEMPGSYAICPLCFREDDGVQFRRPTMSGLRARSP